MVLISWSCLPFYIPDFDPFVNLVLELVKFNAILTMAILLTGFVSDRPYHTSLIYFVCTFVMVLVLNRNFASWYFLQGLDFAALYLPLAILGTSFFMLMVAIRFKHRDYFTSRTS